jgi:hypothetical protein
MLYILWPSVIGELSKDSLIVSIGCIGFELSLNWKRPKFTFPKI